MDKSLMRDLTYGMFVLTTKYNEKNVGCFVNTVVQITSEEVTIAVSVNKNNYTNQAIKESKKFAVSILSEKTRPEVIGKFGFFTSKDVNKFEGFNFSMIQGLPVILENVCGYFICDLIQVVEMNTHDIFIAKVIDCKKESVYTPMTYAYYHQVIKGKAPKTAPTYIEEKTEVKSKYKRYQCDVCGHIYDEEKEKVKFEDLPSDWKCPLCKVGKEHFKLIN